MVAGAGASHEGLAMPMWSPRGWQLPKLAGTEEASDGEAGLPIVLGRILTKPVLFSFRLATGLRGAVV